MTIARIRRRAIEPVDTLSYLAAIVKVGRPQGFQHGVSREDDEDHGVECKLRFARSALNSYSVALVVVPANSVLRFFLNCGQHKFPRLPEATAGSSDCPASITRKHCHLMRSGAMVPATYRSAFRRGCRLASAIQPRTANQTTAVPSPANAIRRHPCPWHRVCVRNK